MVSFIPPLFFMPKVPDSIRFRCPNKYSQGRKKNATPTTRNHRNSTNPVGRGPNEVSCIARSSGENPWMFREFYKGGPPEPIK